MGVLHLKAVVGGGAVGGDGVGGAEGGCRVMWCTVGVWCVVMW